MSSRIPTDMNGPNQATAGAADKLSGAASQLKDSVADAGRAASEKIDEKRRAAASGLDTAASVLHEKGDSVANVAHTAADKLSSTAEYLRRFDAKSLISDLQGLVRDKPGQSLLVAAAIGFLVGRTLTRND
jgi:ElaB/YqjD/DUF883 family membrane-anchored ribosome-binding protein